MSFPKFKRSPERTLSVDLLGGVCNQLFRYFAATFIAENLNLRVRYFLGELPEDHSQFNSRIEDLGFSIVPETRAYQGKYSLFSRKVLNYVCAKSVFLRRVDHFVRGIHTEHGLGPLGECNLILKKFERFPYPRNIHLDGHFQDIMYFSMASTAISPILDSQIKGTDLGGLCVVHIRRGDFKHHKSDIGLLSKDYYKNAMSNFIHSCNSPRFLIISDDMSEAESMVADEHRRFCTFLQESEQMNPAALMMTMNVCKNFILSNSTFSLWIALLAPETKYVAYPMPFNLNLNLQVRGFPNTWKPELAYFE
jgi:hypothetical protein